MLKNLNLKYFIYMLLVVSFLIWFAFAFIRGVDQIELIRLIQILPHVAFVDMILVGLFIKWGWKSKYFKGWLVPFPDLNGTWQGIIQTNWKNPETNETPGPIPAILTIKQTFTYISCVMRTAEMTSYSFAEEFKLDKGRQIKQLVYTYSSKPLLSVADRSTQHDGSITFDIIGNPVEKLKGQYWTARETTGEITLTFREENLLEEIPEDLGKHPLSEN